MVKPGLRLQILLLLGGLLLLAFVPLFFAVATYASITLQKVRDESARSLGRTVVGLVAEARAQRSPSQLATLLHAEVGANGVEAIGIYGRKGEALTRVGEPSAVDALGTTVDPTRESSTEVKATHGRALVMVVPDPRGAVAVLMRTDDESARVTPLVRFLGLYTGLVALALLVFAYYALTRLIVRPLVDLSTAAQRVAGGARRLDVPRGGAREITELATSLRRMTDSLMENEESLRAKIDEVEQSAFHLTQAQDRLVRSERLASVGRLAAGLAHEIGNPLAALIGMQDLLIAGGLEEAEQRDFVERMRKETDRINRILRDLLQFARPAAGGKSPVSVEPGNVESAIYDTITLVRPQSSMKEVELEVDVFPDLPAVSLSKEHLVQVVLNLVLNAGDAVGPGGRVAVRAKRLDVADGETDRIRVEVEDDGPGVSDDVRDRLFEPFVTTKEVGKGTGLGLAVCRGLVEAAGGSIGLDPAYDGGARFVVDLPAGS